ncbi:MAG: YciI family protein [Acidimicrobiia bacterium]
MIETMYRDVDVINNKMRDAGVWVFAGGLHEPSTATVVRAENGQVVMTDGPFIEAKEHLGGFWVIEAPDLDAALAWAAEASAACQGAVEVRPFQGE